KPMGCYTENRATLHLHGGITPWISDGTPHQWTAPANESTSYPKGVSASYVPDMWFDANGGTVGECAGQTTCAVVGATNDPGRGALTFYYTNQQSARLLFYHDHSWGITRLNVYAGEAAGYLITDNTEQALIAAGGPLDASDPALGYGIPLVIQDRTFVPSAAQLAVQDPTWDATRWGTTGNFWYHHVYMPAQNPADATGVSPFGRWMYGPWFWPPANQDTTPYQPIPNPYYVAGCDPATAPNGFCEPPQIPGTPNISVGMEQFNDTPIVNGTAYPTVTVDPKAYRFRLLNAANDRFFNLQWYVADSSGTEVALNAAEVAAAQNDPNVFPTPDTTLSPKGPSWIQIGSEGGFLPTPVTVPNQPITWITDPTRFDFGNVDQHSMLIAPAERADVIVDFSKYAGKTLILYNDAPAAFPARQASYDYYTGDPDNTDIGGAPTTVPGFGPNTRTVMQVKVNASSATPSLFSLSKLISAFAHTAAGTGVFESGQHPVIVGQAGYNRAYGTKFTSSGDCSSSGTTTPCDGFARISQQGGDLFTFDTLSGSKLSIPLQPKALHDEMNASTFDEYGRMTANLGVEAVPATAGLQNVVLYPYVNPATEVIDGSKLPSSIQVTPIATNDDGTQIWKITHNGVDTHPIHFHLYDVQVINRVTWDNIIIPPDLTELGWKDTVRVSPLEDTYFAIRPIIPSLPFQVPNSIRPLNPMVPLGMSMGFNSIGPDGQATRTTITNQQVNFGWEYVWHCHILSHEEMDMMRPISVGVTKRLPTPRSASYARNATTGIVTLTWSD
ncbi:MAG TPA: multicopper oxidase domain-containing protein, partial [Terriglobales bacterium]|nr:multicopper oxidase domain-containing protein [Terriglobales bacterium]